jgi:hypothetical protein
LSPIQVLTPSIPENGIENLSSQIENSRIKNFGFHQSNDDNDISRMISRSRPYSQRVFNQAETSRHETNNSCEFIPQSNMIRYQNLLHGISLFIDQSLTLTNLMIDQGKQLAYLLSALACEVFHMPVETMHLFRDIDSGMTLYLYRY